MEKKLQQYVGHHLKVTIKHYKVKAHYEWATFVQISKVIQS
jgi:hypothetical protein